MKTVRNRFSTYLPLTTTLRNNATFGRDKIYVVSKFWLVYKTIDLYKTIFNLLSMFNFLARVEWIIYSKMYRRKNHFYSRTHQFRIISMFHHYRQNDLNLPIRLPYRRVNMNLMRTCRYLVYHPSSNEFIKTFYFWARIKWIIFSNTYKRKTINMLEH